MKLPANHNRKFFLNGFNRNLAFGVMLGATGAAAAQEPTEVPRINPAPAFSGERLASLPREDWITNGGNVYNQRFSPLDEIDHSNVLQLR